MGQTQTAGAFGLAGLQLVSPHFESRCCTHPGSMGLAPSLALLRQGCSVHLCRDCPSTSPDQSSALHVSLCGCFGMRTVLLHRLGCRQPPNGGFDAQILPTARINDAMDTASRDQNTPRETRRLVGSESRFNSPIRNCGNDLHSQFMISNRRYTWDNRESMGILSSRDGEQRKVDKLRPRMSNAMSDSFFGPD